MNILRLSTISLGLALAALALLNANPSSAKGKTCDEGDTRPKCTGGDDPPVAAEYMVSLTTGAFILSAPATLEGDDVLRGDNDVTIVRPGYPYSCGEIVSDPDEFLACQTWSDVFDVCGIYDINGPDPYGPDEFTASAGSSGGWRVFRFFGGLYFQFGEFPVSSPISPDDLQVRMRLESECSYSPDDVPDKPLLCPQFLPESGTSVTFDMDRYQNHAKGTKGVTHRAECHEKQGDLFPLSSTLVITAPPPPSP